MYNILIVDDQKIIREGLKKIIKSNNEKHLIIEAEDGCKAVKLAENYNFDIILMDLSMPIMNGIEATEKIMVNNGHNKVLAITMQTNMSEINKMKNAGAVGYILKDNVDLDLIDKITRAINGELFFLNDIK